jgi:hypothetical protein
LGDRAARKINFFLWKAVKRRFRLTEICRQQRLGRMSDPIGNAEGAELAKVAIVKN